MGRNRRQETLSGVVLSQALRGDIATGPAAMCLKAFDGRNLIPFGSRFSQNQALYKRYGHNTLPGTNAAADRRASTLTLRLLAGVPPIHCRTRSCDLARYTAEPTLDAWNGRRCSRCRPTNCGRCQLSSAFREFRLGITIRHHSPPSQSGVLAAQLAVIRARIGKRVDGIPIEDRHMMEISRRDNFLCDQSAKGPA